MAERHLKLDLTEGVEHEDINPFRPFITAWQECDDDYGEIVSVSIHAAWGCSQRFLTLKPREARQLADILTSLANKAERPKLELVEEPVGL